jgi:predicted glycoside hydrolase/deacetylase ChbG (UPF0249 family)
MGGAMERYVIINSDDFGMTPGVNRGVIDCYRAGLLTSATIMVGSDAFEEAAAAARENPGLGIGIHVSFTSGRRYFLSERLRRFPLETRGVHRFLPAYLCGLIPKDIVRQEISLQIERLLAAGIEPTHIDSHHHIHAFPSLLPIFLEVAKRYGIRKIRLPEEFYSSARYTPRSSSAYFRSSFTMHNAKIRAFRRIVRPSAARIREAGFSSPARLFGTPLYWYPDLATWEGILDEAVEAGPGFHEMMVHVGYVDDLLRRITTLSEGRETLLRLLLSPEAKSAFEKRGLRPAGFRDLPVEQVSTGRSAS